MLTRYEQAYPGVFRSVDEPTARRAVQILGTTATGQLLPRRDLADLLDRVAGRITFEEYKARGRLSF